MPNISNRWLAATGVMDPEEEEPTRAAKTKTASKSTGSKTSSAKKDSAGGSTAKAPAKTEAKTSKVKE